MANHAGIAHGAAHLLIAEDKTVVTVHLKGGPVVPGNQVQLLPLPGGVEIEEHPVPLHLQPKVEGHDVGEIPVVEGEPAHVALPHDRDDLIKIRDLSVFSSHSVLLLPPPSKGSGQDKHI